jgi:protein TonB
MFSTFFQPSSEQEREALRRRLIGFPLVLLAHLIIVLLLMQIAATVLPKDMKPPTVFNLMPDKGDEAKSTKVEKAKKAAGGATAKAPATKRAPRETPASEVDTTKTDNSFSSLLIPGLEKFDVRDVPQRGQQVAQGEGAGAGPGADDGSGDGGGAGPGGERLYDADWARRPTDAELGGYLPKNSVRSGSGLIACRTVEGNRVEDCKIIGEDPPGSGFGRAVLNAAWQFRVLPPRVGSRRLVGSWVRIRIDYSERGVDVR